MDSRNPRTPLERAVSLLENGSIDKFYSYTLFLNDEIKSRALRIYCDRLLARFPLTADKAKTVKKLESIIMQVYSTSPPEDFTKYFSKVKREVANCVNACEKQNLYRQEIPAKGSKTRTLQEVLEFLENLLLNSEISASSASDLYAKWYDDSNMEQLPSIVYQELQCARSCTFWGRNGIDLKKTIDLVRYNLELEKSRSQKNVFTGLGYKF